jgi:hypothetical protein
MNSEEIAIPFLSEKPVIAKRGIQSFGHRKTLNYVELSAACHLPASHLSMEKPPPPSRKIAIYKPRTSDFKVSSKGLKANHCCYWLGSQLLRLLQS